MEKIFCIGMFKTGTSSMAIAFEKLGYKTLRGPWWPKGIMIMDDFYERPNEWIPYYTVIKDKIGHYNAFVDYPWMFLYDKIDNWYPQARFVLTVRDSEALAKSDQYNSKQATPPLFFEDGFVLTAMSADFAGGLVVVADHDSLSVGIVYGEEKLMTVFLGQAGPLPPLHTPDTGV